MVETIITIYVICDELLTAIGFRDDPQCQMSTAEVMTTALVSATYFGGSYTKSRAFLKDHGYIPRMLSKSRFNRRLHRIPSAVWEYLFYALSRMFQEQNTDNEYALDSFPVPVCDNIRIRRCHLYQDEAYRGYTASKRRYFYGIKVHFLVTKNGEPVEFFLSPGAESDLTGLKRFKFDLPKEAIVYLDRLYNDYDYEDLINQCTDIRLEPMRKKNSKRARDPWIEAYIQRTRRHIETAISVLEQAFPKTIHAVIPEGFELKIVLFLISYSITCLSL